jgi:hypothetical protein
MYISLQISPDLIYLVLCDEQSFLRLKFSICLTLLIKNTNLSYLLDLFTSAV